MKLMIIGFGSFLLVIFVVFSVLKMSEPEKKQATVSSSGSPKSKKVNDKYTKNLEKKYKNLQKELTTIKKDIGKSSSVIDSLQKILASKESSLSEQKNQIEKLSESLTQKETQEKSAQDLAKTFSSMKTDEMRPILKNIDDRTIRMIYENVNSRMRKNFLLALTPQRAASLTKQLAAAN